jgi:hypothetical protein
MFVRYYLELPLPPARVEAALLGSPEWLSELAGEAQRRGDVLLAEVGVGPLGPRLGRRVAVQLGEPVAFPSMTSLPMTWEPLGLDGAVSARRPGDHRPGRGRTAEGFGLSWPLGPATMWP